MRNQVIGLDELMSKTTDYMNVYFHCMSWLLLCVACIMTYLHLEYNNEYSTCLDSLYYTVDERDK